MLLHTITVTAAKLIARDNNWGNDENKSCVYATPGPDGNVPITACNAYYNDNPQFAPAVAVAVLFGIFTGIHLFEGVVFRKVSAIPILFYYRLY